MKSVCGRFCSKKCAVNCDCIQSEDCDSILRYVAILTFQAVTPVGGGAGWPNTADHWGDATSEPAAAVHPCSGAVGVAAATHLSQAVLLSGQHTAGLLQPLQGESHLDSRPTSFLFCFLY